MKIGIDLDDTLCNTFEIMRKYQNIFLSTKNITLNSFQKSQKYKEEFLKKYLKQCYQEATIKKGAIEILKKLKEEGNELYIITNRNNNYIKEPQKLIIDYLKKYNILINNIYINTNNKVKICQQLKIDLMIDDNIYIYSKLLAHDIETILFDDMERYKEFNNRVTSWQEVYEYICKNYNKHILTKHIN